MKMRVKLKVKHIVWLGAGLLATWLLLSFLIFPQISLYQAKKKLDSGDAAGKGEVFALLENGRIFKQQQWGLINNYMISDNVIHSFDVVVSPSFIQAATPATVHFFPDEIEPFLKRYLTEAPANMALSQAAKQLAFYYANEGQVDEAYRVLKATQERFTREEQAWERQELYLNQVELAVYFGDMDKAKQFLQQAAEIEGDDFFQTELALAEAELELKQGNLETALQLVKDGKKTFEAAWEKEQEMFPNDDTDITSSVTYDHVLTLQTHLEDALQGGKAGITKVNGSLTRKDGTPIAHAGVFLREQHVASRSVQPNEPYQTTTDKDGNFVFHGVIPGNYQINLGLTFEQVDGLVWPTEMDGWIRVDGREKIDYDISLQPLLNTYSPTNDAIITGENVTFTWEASAEASYYNLSLGVISDEGAFSVVFKTKLRETEIVVPVEELYAKTVGMLFADTPLEDLEGAGNLLAFADPNKRFVWSVQAYDKNSNLITRSDGYRLSLERIGNVPTFYVKERKLTKADQLLIQDKAPAALRAYLDAYEQNPKDVHSLRMIMRMIGAESERSRKSEAQLRTPYLAELVRLGGASSDDISLLAENYAELKEWGLFQQTFEAYSKAVHGELSNYDKEFYALALMQQGKLTEARKELRELMHKEKGNPQLGTLLALEIGINNSFDEALMLAKMYPAELDPWRMPVHWEALVTELEATMKNAPQQFTHLQTGLNLFFANDEEELTKWLASEQNNTVKEFFRALQEE